MIRLYKLRRIISALTAIVLLGAIFPSLSFAEAGENIRGVWVSTVFNIDFPSQPTTNSKQLMRETDEILDNCADMGFNTVFLQVRPTGDAIYKSKVFPYSRWLTGSEGTAPSGGTDILEYWINGAHKRGIELHAWINPYRVTVSHTPLENLSPKNPARLHPEYLVEYNGNYYYNPAMPEVRNLITDCAVEIAENYNVDGIHMDDYFYPGDLTDYDDYLKYNHDNLSLEDWRRSNTDALVEQMSAALRKRNVTFGISPAGIWANKKVDERGSDTVASGSYDNLYADTLKWVKEGWLDYVAPQIYWEIGNNISDYKTLLGWWSDAVAGTGTKLYIGMADYKAADAKEDSVWYGGAPLIDEFELNDEYGTVDGEIHFSYSSVAENQTIHDIVSDRNLSCISDQNNTASLGSDIHIPADEIFKEYGLHILQDTHSFSDWFIMMIKALLLQHSFN